MDFDKFAKLIALLESSGGKNTKHRTIDKGLQTGQTAVGKYGLLPNTMEEMLKRSKMEGTQLPDMQAVDGLPQAEIASKVAKNPDLEEELAFRLYDHISKKTQDPEKMAYMWNTGHNMNPDDIDVSDSTYVDKFNKQLKADPDRDNILKAEIERRIKEEEGDPRMAALDKLSRGL